MTMHATEETFEQLRTGRLPAQEVLALTRHLAECPRCADLARTADPARAARALQAQLVEDEHPDVDTVLFPYVDGTLDAGERAAVEEHLAACESCRLDADALKSAAASVQRAPRTRRWPLALVAAAAAVIVLIASLWLRSASRGDRAVPPNKPQPIRVTPVPPRAPSYGNAEWDALVSDARTRGRIDAPSFLQEILAGRERLRTTESAPRAGVLAPAGVVVAPDRPRFTWPARDGARYVVSVFAGDEKIAESPVLDEPSWTPVTPLPRGITIGWQVEIHGAGEPSLIPVPPDPPALFRIVEAKRLSEIAEARKRFPGDSLLPALLYARAGMQREAAGELRLHIAAHPEARPLLDSVERWESGQ